MWSEECGVRYASRLEKQEAGGKKQEICFEYKLKTAYDACISVLFSLHTPHSTFHKIFRKLAKNLFSIQSVLDLIHISIDHGYGGDVHHVAYRRTEVGEVNRFVQSHLNRTDDLHVSIQGLEHLVG